jgi:hypothetical protein
MKKMLQPTGKTRQDQAGGASRHAPATDQSPDPPDDRLRIRLGHSRAPDPRAAVREFHAAVAQPSMALVVFFCSSEWDLEAIADEMARQFAGVPTVGCTTAGEIGSTGYQERSLAGASLPAEACRIATGRLADLPQFSAEKGRLLAESLLQQLKNPGNALDPANSFALLLIDGLSMREEQVTQALQHALGKIPLVGGSAGDGLKFSRTHVYHEGRFHLDSAVLILAETSLPFRVFNTQHFVANDAMLVVTAADPAHRIVKEINGLPAAVEYAAAIGVKPGELGPERFALSPLVVRIDGANYVRSIQSAHPDGSLTFYCAIEEGLVFRVAHGVDFVENLRQTLDRLRSAIGPPQFILACDCILRKLEVERRHLRPEVEKLLRDNRVIGFSTYGEQFGGVHMNQTLTGIAIGLPGKTPHA